MFFWERRIMFRETEQLKQKLEEMLASNDTEWVNAVSVTLNAMYRQFQLEQQDRLGLNSMLRGAPIQVFTIRLGESWPVISTGKMQG
jgi:hypothetical protein